MWLYLVLAFRVLGPEQGSDHAAPNFDANFSARRPLKQRKTVTKNARVGRESTDQMKTRIPCCRRMLRERMLHLMSVNSARGRRSRSRMPNARR